MKHLIGKQITKKVPFMGEEVEIRPLTVGQAREIESISKASNELEEKDKDHLILLRKVVRMAVVGAEELTDEELDSFPIIELSNLSQAIMGSDGELGNG
jgi:hypothetical protein